jgi:hypothetical protein
MKVLVLMVHPSKSDVDYIIIKSLVFKEPPKDLQLASIISKATKLTQKLNKHTLYHVL